MWQHEEESKTLAYNLRAIVYYGQFHFTERLFDPLQGIWAYDGQKNNGFPRPEYTWTDCSDLHKLTISEGRSAHIYIYGLSS